MMMHSRSTRARSPVVLPNAVRHSAPSPSQPSPQYQTAGKEIAPEGMGRPARRWRSKSASNASFKYIPPVYNALTPRNSSGSFAKFSWPPSHQPARQLDQTVGKCDTRLKASNTRSWRAAVRFIAQSKQEKLPAGQPAVGARTFWGRQVPLV